MNRIQTLLDIAKEELLAAELLLNHNLYRSSISRSYYALYHTVQALLAAKNINTRTHKGAIQKFGQHFIKTGELSPKLSQFLGDTFDLRHLSDYDETVKISQQQAQLTLDNAKFFIEQVITYLNH
ncbi:MAG: HEPN domain-containing protein [Microcystaceae cyanobacterium]